MVLGFKPKYKVHGGSEAENLALQNIQVCGLLELRCLEAELHLPTGAFTNGSRLHVCPTSPLDERQIRWIACSW
jgi:hypothetical protein